MHEAGKFKSLIPREVVATEDYGQFSPDSILGGQNFLDPRSQIGYPETVGGVLRNAKPTEDTILITFLVSNANKAPTGSIVSMKDVPLAPTAQWQIDGKEFTATTPKDYKKAPPHAASFQSRRYNGDGNSFRVATFKKGGKTNMATPARTDVLIYVISGRMLRKEGKETFEMKAGDATREMLRNPGMWEVLEDSVFIATDAPFNPAIFSPDLAAPRT